MAVVRDFFVALVLAVTANFWRRQSVGGRDFGGEAFGGEGFRRRFPDRRRGTFFPDLGEQPGLGRGGRPVSLRIIVGKTAALEDDGA